MGLSPSHSLTLRYVLQCPLEVSPNSLQVPDKPSAAVEEQRGIADRKILKRLQDVGLASSGARHQSLTAVQLFQERPVWTRAAIFNQFMPFEIREIVK